MNCARAGELIMKYIDASISAKEAAELHKHIAVCESCRADFLIYDEIVKGFSDMQLIEAPADMEERVMERIKDLPAPGVAVEKGINIMVMAAGIIFVTIMSLGFIIFMNRDIITETLSLYPGLSGYVEMLASVESYVSDFTGNVWNIVAGFSASAMSFVDSYKYILLAGVVITLVVQFALRGRSKAKKVEE